MAKIIFRVVLFILLAGFIGIASFIAHKIITMPSQGIPYPYVFESIPKPAIPELTNVVLLGDRMGVKFATYIPLLEEAISKGLNKGIKITNLTSTSEGLHRTLIKLKSLKPFPKVVIFHGGSEEYLEKKFETKEAPKILHNFSLYQKDSVQTALLFSQETSKFIYTPVERVKLSPEFTPNFERYSDVEVLSRQEVLFKIYEKEFAEFVEYTKAHDSILVIVSTPLNLDVPPKRPCELADYSSFNEKQPAIEALEKAGDFKGAYNQLMELAPTNQGNAEYYFDLGQVLKNLNQKAQGISEIEKSMAYDCRLWRGGEIYNVIQQRAAAKAEVFYFDFSQMLKDQWGNNLTFFDELYPQDFYYQKAVNILGSMLKKYFKI